MERWSDDRLDDRFADVGRRFDDIDRCLRELGHLPQAIAVLTVETKQMRGRLGELVGNPAAEARASRQTLRTGLITAFFASTIVVVGSVLTGIIH